MYYGGWKKCLFYDPVVSRPPTLGARFRRKFCDLHASIYGTLKIAFSYVFAHSASHTLFSQESSCTDFSHRWAFSMYSKPVLDWIGLCSVLRPHQHSIGYTGDGFYRSKDPTNSIKVLKENLQKKITQRTKKTQNTHAYTQNGKKNTVYSYNTASPLVYNNTG